METFPEILETSADVLEISPEVLGSSPEVQVISPEVLKASPEVLGTSPAQVTQPFQKPWHFEKPGKKPCKKILYLGSGTIERVIVPWNASDIIIPSPIFRLKAFLWQGWLNCFWFEESYKLLPCVGST